MPKTSVIADVKELEYKAARGLPLDKNGPLILGTIAILGIVWVRFHRKKQAKEQKSVQKGQMKLKGANKEQGDLLNNITDGLRKSMAGRSSTTFDSSTKNDKQVTEDWK